MSDSIFGDAMYKALFEHSVDALSILEPETGLFVACNDSAVNLHDTGTKEKFIGTTPDVLSPKFQPNGELSSKLAMEHINQTLENGRERFEWVHCKSDGTPFTVQVTLCVIVEQGSKFILAIGKDITELKQVAHDLYQTQESLKDSLNRVVEKNVLLEKIQKIAKIGIISWDLKTNEVTWSNELYHMYCVEPGTPQTIETNMSMVFQEDLEMVQKSLENAAAGINEHDITHRILRADGVVIWVEAKANVEKDKDGTPVKLVGSIIDISDKKHTSDNYDLLFNRMRDACVFNSGSGKMLDSNPAYCEMLGYTSEEIKDVSWKDITPPKWLDWELETHGKQLIERGYTDLYEKEYIRKDGTIFPIENQAYLLNNPDNIDDAIIAGFIRDISQRKSDEAARFEIEQRFRQVTENINEVFWLGSPDWQEIYYISPAYEDKWGRTIQSLYDDPLSWMTAVHSDDKELVIEDIARSQKNTGGNVVFRDYRIVKPNGEIRWVKSRAYPIKNSEGEVYRIAGIADDITELKTQQEKLITNNEIVTNMTEGAYLIRVSDGIILYTNKAFEIMFGYEHGEMLGQHVSIVNAPVELNPEETVEKISRDIKKTGSWRGDVNNIKKDGTHFWCSASVTTFHHPEHGDVWVSVHTDITEKRHTENILRRTQKMDALGKLTGGIAHDYNNMLGVIMGYSELLQSELSNQPKLAKYAKAVQHAGERGANLTRKLLSFSRHNISESVELNINKSLIDMQLMLEKSMTANIQLNMVLGKDLWDVWLDSGDLEDAILNICINASYAMEGAGIITIQTSNKKIDETDLTRVELDIGEYIMLSVADTGCGIDEAAIENIFDPFYSTKGKNGTGLGLSQVYGFVERSHGAITINSKINQGTQFKLYFPRYRHSKSSEQIRLNSSNTKFKGDETILVVDDEIALLNLTREILINSGYTVKVANSGQEALDLLKHNAVDLIISDVVMPHMNGYELASKIMKLYPSIKIQLASGFNEEINYSHYNIQLKRNLLTKPFPQEALLRNIRLLLKH